MDEAIVKVTGDIDRYLFSAGFVSAIVLSGLRIFGIIDWPWRWITAPVWIWIIFTVLRSVIIAMPSSKNSQK